MKSLIAACILATSLSVNAENRQIEVPCGDASSLANYLLTLGEMPVVIYEGETPNITFVTFLNKTKPSWSMVQLTRDGDKVTACLIASGGQFDLVKKEKPNL